MSNNKYNNSTILERLKGLPELNIGDEMGPTQYIDFLKWEDVPEGVMYGYDKYQRLFFVIKCIIDDNKYVQTFFQRYIDSIYAWSSGNYHLHIIDTNGGILDNQFDFLFELIKNKKAILKSEHKPTYSITHDFNNSNFKGKQILIFNEKEWNAAKIIQKSWRLCRYDPTYKMCSNVTLNNIKEIEKEYNRVILT